MNKKPFSAEELEQLARLEAMRDEDIDVSDASVLTDAQWASDRRPAYYKPVKRPVTIRLDADVVDWFKDHAKGAPYQTEINRVLRQHVAKRNRA